MGRIERAPDQSTNLTILLERKTGFEPATLSLARRCSTTEPLPPGAERQDRTADTAIFSRVLYQLSYLGQPLDLREAPGTARVVAVQVVYRALFSGVKTATMAPRVWGLK